MWKKWTLMGLFMVVVGLVGGGSFPGGIGTGEGNTWECPEYDRDFSVGCADPRNTDCGSRCFWPECVKCTDARHCHSVLRFGCMLCV